MKFPTHSLLFLSMCSFAVAQSPAQSVADAKSFHKIVFLGDSITRTSPTPRLNWTGDWGMAATAENKDYAHLFLAKLAAASGAGAPPPEVWIFREGAGKVTDKLAFLDKITAFRADLALVQLGENDRTDITVEGFQQPYEKLLAALRTGNPNVRILCAGVWGTWPSGDHTKDKMIRAACEKYQASFADLGAAYADPANRAGADHRFTDAAVNWHPGDGGMAAYADAFWKALSASPGTSTATEATPRSPE